MEIINKMLPLKNKETSVKKRPFKKVFKFSVYTFLGILSLLVIAGITLSIYFSNHKAEIVTDINQKINENIKGTVAIGDVSYTLIKGFPNFALTIDNVVLKDSLWAQHKHTLLTAKEIEVHINVKKLILDKEVDIEKIQINDATINLYVDKNGVSNSSDVFKPKPKDTVAKPKKKITIDEIALDNVKFISQNIQRDKLFDFDVTSLESKIEYTDTGWNTDLYIDTFAKSMAFKLAKGSFIKDKKVEGKLAITFSAKENNITVVTEKLGIGEDKFDITAHFSLNKKTPLFDLNITTEILWTNAAKLLDAHIYKILNHLNLTKPLKANCTIAGNMSVAGDPVIVVKAIIKDNELISPDGTFTDCSFNGEYNNTFKKGMGTSDENSAVILTNFSAQFKKIPFSIPKVMLYNLKIPVATGVFKSKFNLQSLDQFIHEDLMTFTEGNADVNLKFNVNLAKFKINKPIFSGNVLVKAATLNYIPKDISFQKTDLLLNFTEDALIIDKLKYTNGDNTVFMKGKIDDFLKLYYKDSGKMILNWKIYSPNFDVQHFIGMLGKKNKNKTPKDPTKKVVSGKLQSMIDDSQVNIDIKADKMTYKNLTANYFTTSIQLDNGQLFVKNGLIKTCNGAVTFDTQLIPNNNLYNFSADANINTVAIPQFLTAFNNFGIISFQPNDIKGNLTVKTSFKGSITQTGELVENSLVGKVNYKIINGSLNNFEPIIKVGKIVFPNRDVKNIDLEDLEGRFDINGEQITVDEFYVSSSIINFDVGGVYSFGKGTNLQMTIPLRNPVDDYKITDSIQRANLRYKGIVAHLQAVDGPDGKIQIKLDPQDVELSNPFKSTKNKKKSKNK